MNETQAIKSDENKKKYL